MTAIQMVVKRGMDIALSLFGLVALSPLLLLISVLVRLDSVGPAVFSQQRVGKDGRAFPCHKFRTMYVNSVDLRNADGSTFNAGNDPRVTKVGRFLRKTSLDELPQLVNVLKGEMSLVGPRPELRDHLRRYSERDKKRLLVRPGMTGWASVHGRNAISWGLRRELDVQYVERYSLWLDLQIIAQTIPTVLLGKGVHVPAELANRFPAPDQNSELVENQ